MGETLEVIQNEFGGVSLRDGHIVINPSLPNGWRRLSFKQKFRGVLISLDIYPNEVKVVVDKDITVTIYNRTINLHANEEQQVSGG